MAKIVCIHGVAQQLKGPETLAAEWIGHLRDGMRAAGAERAELPSNEDISVAFFGDLFRGQTKGDPYAPYELADIEEGFETQFLSGLAREADAEQAGNGTDSPDQKAGWMPRTVQDVAVSLMRVKFFSQLADRALVGALKQARWYLTDPLIRAEARRRFAEELSGETRLVIGHSLGSIVAYEVLCRAEPPLSPAFITLGSPIGWPNIIFDRLDPKPENGRGCWPAATTSWTNISDAHDIVAAVKRLSPLFDGRIDDVEVNNEVLAHDVQPYLTARQTGAAIRRALHAN